MLSIHPVFAHAIFSGEKTIEFRKLNIPNHINHVVLYVTAPESRILGYFSVKNVVEDLVDELWNRFSDVSGTTEKFFFQYYSKHKVGRGFMVDEVCIFKHPITLDKIKAGGKPPQSFTYIDKKTWRSLKRRKTQDYPTIQALSPRNS